MLISKLPYSEGSIEYSGVANVVFVSPLNEVMVVVSVRSYCSKAVMIPAYAWVTVAIPMVAIPAVW